MDVDRRREANTAGYSAERIARNDAIFRDANESIKESAETHGFETAVPFICECADPNCTEVVQLTLREYEAVRSEPTLFLNVPGHQVAAQRWGRVVETHDNYFVVEKIGPAADVVEQLDGNPDPANAPVEMEGPYGGDRE